MDIWDYKLPLEIASINIDFPFNKVESVWNVTLGSISIAAFEYSYIKVMQVHAFKFAKWEILIHFCVC